MALERWPGPALRVLIIRLETGIHSEVAFMFPVLQTHFRGLDKRPSTRTCEQHQPGLLRRFGVSPLTFITFTSFLSFNSRFLTNFTSVTPSSMRVFSIVSVICTAAAVVLSMLSLFAGWQPNFIEDADIMVVSLWNLLV